jgi:hypothetical protein
LWLTEVAAPIAAVADANGDELETDPITANAPRLLMVIVDQYQYGYGPDCTALSEVSSATTIVMRWS